jgi:hypothetical protein
MIELWSLCCEESGRITHLHHRYWRGYSFYSSIADFDDEPTLGSYGGMYFGWGLPTTGLEFRL